MTCARIVVPDRGGPITNAQRSAIPRHVLSSSRSHSSAERTLRLPELGDRSRSDLLGRAIRAMASPRTRGRSDHNLIGKSPQLTVVGNGTECRNVNSNMRDAEAAWKRFLAVPRAPWL